MSAFQPQQDWAGLSRLTLDQQQRYKKLEDWQQGCVQYTFEQRWKAENLRAEQARSPWQKWKSATLELLRWWWGIVA